jgi:hypothetical protein
MTQPRLAGGLRPARAEPPRRHPLQRAPGLRTPIAAPEGWPWPTQLRNWCVSGGCTSGSLDGWTAPGKYGLPPPNSEAAVSVLRPWDCGTAALAPRLPARPDMQLTIDTEADTYKQVIAAPQARCERGYRCEGSTPLSRTTRGHAAFQRILDPQWLTRILNGPM